MSYYTITFHENLADESFVITMSAEHAGQEFSASTTINNETLSQPEWHDDRHKVMHSLQARLDAMLRAFDAELSIDLTP